MRTSSHGINYVKGKNRIFAFLGPQDMLHLERE
jgi:hypothetical protein